MNFYMPVKLYTGSGCIESHKEVFDTLGKRCLIVTGPNAAKKCGALDDVTAVLDSLNIEYTIYDRISQNPSVLSCRDAGLSGFGSKAEFIIGIGGGSPLDAAKAASVFAANPEIDESDFYALKWNRTLPVVLIGTTSGTGSEVTNVSVLTDCTGRKHSIHDNKLYAYASFGDPKYTMSLPLPITLSTGIDVLTHCAESWFSKKANDISKSFSVSGINLLYPALKAAADGKELSLQQRSELYDASVLGGLAICVTGTCFPHNVGYYLTENFHVPHGFACASLFPELIEYAGSAAPECTDEFFKRINPSKEDLLELVKSVLPEYDISVSDMQIDSALPRWSNNGSVKNTIGNVTTENIRHWLEKYRK